jgi:hypothetical protein
MQKDLFDKRVAVLGNLIAANIRLLSLIREACN